MNQGTQIFRPPVAPIGMHRRVASEREELSEKFMRHLAVVFLVAVVFVSAMSMYFHGRVGSERATLEQLQAVRRTMGNENIKLLATRAELSSLNRVQSVAAVRLQLYLPEDGQQHRLY